MSLLANTSYANPTTPFWASATGGGGGGGVIIVSNMVAEYAGSIATPFDTYTILTGSLSTDKSGYVMVTGCLNYFANGVDTYMTINVKKNTNIEYTATASCNSNAPSQAYSFNIALPYTANDSDTYEYEIVGGDYANPSFNTSASFIFYANP